MNLLCILFEIGCITITNPQDFLNSQPLLQSDPSFHLFDRRQVQIGDCNGERCIFSYPPYQGFNPLNGDGGDHYKTENGATRIDLTQDGGKPYLQHFLGPECGLDGWVLWKNTAKYGQWQEMVARLKNSQTSQCPPPFQQLSYSFTRWRLEDIAWTFTFPTGDITATLRTIISEHYNNVTIATSTALERFYFAENIGRVHWSSWQKTPNTLSIQCTQPPFNIAPTIDWQCTDYREWTLIKIQTTQTFNWP